ncbi:hypothetical protein DSO57_1017525 [Entomophthora muscae]|uniref:Uncharacterized protein n=1 Tax=Entomophthora muscae TaxID=34485 RepID=A0ACC2T4Y3_9FUNG|nr:hypothetical protein DSO57_1017525 [Entomophthora muscae]
MSFTSNIICYETPSLKLYAHGDVGIHTMGLFNGNVPMTKRKDTYWRSNSNFTNHFLSLAERLQKSNISTYQLERFEPKTFYYWEGGSQVTDPICCFENEQCTANLTWNGRAWISKISNQWIKSPSFEIPVWSKASYTRTDKSKKVKFSYTFNGPKNKTVYFNKMTPMIMFQFNNVFPSSAFNPIWLNCSHSLTMEGVMGITEQDLFHM